MSHLLTQLVIVGPFAKFHPGGQFYCWTKLICLLTKKEEAGENINTTLWDRGQKTRGKQSTNEEEEVENKKDEGENGVRCRRRLPEAWKTWSESNQADKELEGDAGTRKTEPVNKGEDVIMRKQRGKEKKRKLAQWWRNKQLRERRRRREKRGQLLHIWMVLEQQNVALIFLKRFILCRLSIPLVHSTGVYIAFGHIDVQVLHVYFMVQGLESALF